MVYLCTMMTASEIIGYMESLRNEKQRQVLMGFFKTGPGQYGEGDEFLGLKVPQTREVVKLAVADTPLDEVPQLLMSCWHEVRLCGLLMLVDKFGKLATKRLANDEAAIDGRDAIVAMYLKHAEQANFSSLYVENKINLEMVCCNNCIKVFLFTFAATKHNK